MKRPEPPFSKRIHVDNQYITLYSYDGNRWDSDASRLWQRVRREALFARFALGVERVRTPKAKTARRELINDPSTGEDRVVLVENVYQFKSGTTNAIHSRREVKPTKIAPTVVPFPTPPITTPARLRKGALKKQVVNYNRHIIVEGAAYVEPPPPSIITFHFERVEPTLTFNPDGTVRGLTHEWVKRAVIHIDDDLLVEYGLL